MQTYFFKVAEELKTRLDKFLAQQLPEISRSRIQRDIELGQVSVNGETATEGKQIIRLNDSVNYEYHPELPSQPVNLPLTTLYNNHGLLILDKPAGLPVHPGAGFKGDSLAQALLYHFENINIVGEEGRNGIVHRLDKDTSGVIMVALTPEMYEHLKNSFAERKVQKEYIALVRGKITKNHDKIDKPLGKSKKDFRRITTDLSDMLINKPSLTEYWVLEYLTDGIDEYTLIKVKLHTGRTHQIRVHCLSIGHPLVGDELYGGGAKKAFKVGGLYDISIDRQFLHAKRIEVQLPDNTWVEAESKLPEDLRKVLQSLNSKVVNQL
jgi:23S rRNA pseudouridine1911/1915/1917 synthase